MTAVRFFLIRFREEAGAPRDAVEKVLVDQLAVAHLKVGELYALSAEAKNLEFKQMYADSATKLLGAVCQLVSHPDGVPGRHPATPEPRRQGRPRQEAGRQRPGREEGRPENGRRKSGHRTRK